MQTDVLATTRPKPQLQAFQPIQAPYALEVHPPALPTQQHVDPLTAEAGPRLSEFANPQPQRRGIASPTAVVVQRPRQPGQLASARNTGPEGHLNPRDELATLGGR